MLWIFLTWAPAQKFLPVPGLAQVPPILNCRCRSLREDLERKKRSRLTEFPLRNPVQIQACYKKVLNEFDTLEASHENILMGLKEFSKLRTN